MEKEFEIPQEVIDELKRTGIIVVGGKGKGKTNASKVLVQQLLKQPDIRAKIFDSVMNWRFNFVDIPFVELNNNNFNMVYEVPPFVNLLHDVQFIEPRMSKDTIEQIVSRDYILRQEEKRINSGNLVNWVVYVIEEAQNVIGTYALSGKNSFWLKFVSECRNFNMTFLMITQRLADVSPKAIERCHGYLISKMTGDNDLKKLEKITGKEIVERVKRLDIGQHIYFNGEKSETILMQFPLFKSDKNPYPCPVKKTFIQRLFGV